VDVVRAVEIATSFVALVNARDVDGIAAAVTPDSLFFVEGETPTVGRESLREAWAGYFTVFPNYRIFVDESHSRPDAAYLVGHTAGSHLPKELESISNSVIWRCECRGELISEWSIYATSDAARKRFGLNRESG
jgi:ketosteroid isomerase-like protein